MVDWNVEVFVNEGRGFLEGEVRISFATAWPANITDVTQGTGGHLLRETEGIGTERGGLGENGYRHAGAQSRAASAPEAAGATRYGTATVFHFTQGCLELKVRAGIVAGGE